MHNSFTLSVSARGIDHRPRNATSNLQLVA